jgi:hypothetical protein
MTPKNKLHALVDACNDDLLVEEAIALFTAEPADWWDALTEQEQQKTLTAISQLDMNQGIPNADVMQEAWKRIGK